MIKTSELIKLLAERKGFKAKETEDFVGTFFDVIVEGLQTDGIVKIKGLGTFKVTSVKERESINVNTGERVIISGHNKLTFTPDTSMRDMVNKPFSQFETVVINDGVDFADMTEDGDMEDAVETANEETVTTQVTDKVTVKAEDAMKIAEETAEQASPEPVCETNNMMTEKNSSLSCDTRVSSAPSSEIVSPTPQCQDEVLEATHPTTATEPSPPPKKRYNKIHRCYGLRNTSLYPWLLGRKDFRNTIKGKSQNRSDHQANGKKASKTVPNCLPRYSKEPASDNRRISTCTQNHQS